MNETYLEIRKTLIEKRDELTARLENIKENITGGRSADSQEQAQELENSEVVDELDKHPVYGINGTNPWYAEDKSKEKVISKIRNEWGIVDPHRKQMSSKGTKQDHTTGHTQSPLLNPEQ